jgi:hypothetical protein
MTERPKQPVAPPFSEIARNVAIIALRLRATDRLDHLRAGQKKASERRFFITPLRVLTAPSPQTPSPKRRCKKSSTSAAQRSGKASQMLCGAPS